MLCTAITPHPCRHMASFSFASGSLPYATTSPSLASPRHARGLQTAQEPEVSCSDLDIRSDFVFFL
jgi:hypothetical protein